MAICGYGKVLDVDLSERKIEQRDIAPEFARKFIGGMGFSCKILYDEVGLDTDPLSPDNYHTRSIGCQDRRTFGIYYH